MLTQEELKKNLEYIPEKDVFLWKNRRYIERYAGTRAGYTKDGNTYIKINGKVYSKNKLVVLWETGVYPNGNSVEVKKVDSEEEVVSGPSEAEYVLPSERQAVLDFLSASDCIFKFQGTATTAVFCHIMRGYLSSRHSLYVLPTISEIANAVNFGKGSVSKALDMLVTKNVLIRYRLKSPYVYALNSRFFGGNL